MRDETGNKRSPSHNSPSNKGRIVVRLLILCGVFMLQSDRGFAETPSAPQANVTTEEYIAAIKRRAEEILEERRTGTKLQVSVEDTVAAGYEKNPSNLPEHKGDYFVEDDFSIFLSKRLTPTITWQGTYFGSFVNYLQFTDDTYTIQSLTPVRLTWRPTPMWRVNGAVELGDLWYPHSSPSNYRELKPWIEVRQNLWGDWFHSLRYIWSLRHYISARASDGNGNETVTPREDQRHTGRYEVGTTWKETYVKVRNEWYLNDSNDAFNDFYDSRDYRLTTLVSKPLTQRLFLTASYSYELKHYLHRSVIGVSPAVARHDDVQTYALSAIYDLNKTWSFSPSFSYTRDNSNEPTGEYFDWTVSTALTARF